MGHDTAATLHVMRPSAVMPHKQLWVHSSGVGEDGVEVLFGG